MSTVVSLTEQSFSRWNMTCIFIHSPVEGAIYLFSKRTMGTYFGQIVYYRPSGRRVKKNGGYWCYVQVTERQKRGHPHSHLIMCWLPPDATKEIDDKQKPYWDSAYFKQAHVRSGLGTQCRITPVGNPEATAKYVAKYLFKDAMFTTMPKNWHRVRYSHSFPKAVEKEQAENVQYIPLCSKADWQSLSKKDYAFDVNERGVYDYARRRIHNVRYVPVASDRLT